MIFEKQISRKMKYQALYWLRIDQRCAFIATEAGEFSADCIGINEKKVVEVEIKISAEDLKNDFKKPKHHYYRGDSHYSLNNPWIPTHFYFAVPAELVDVAQEQLKKHKCEEYGIINADGWIVVRRAKWLHKREPNSKVKFVLALRMGSELIRFHEAHL